MGNVFTRINNEIKESDVFFLYNDLQRKDSTIDDEFVKIAKNVIKDNKEKEDALVVLHTAKGDLICGEKLALYLRDNYEKVYYYIPERCGEAGTLMALSGNYLSYERESDITPCDPQVVFTNGQIVPTYLFRHLNLNEHILDPIDEGRILIANNNFKNIAIHLFAPFSKDVISRMLDNTYDHNEPLYVYDFKKMGILLKELDPEHIKLLIEAHNEIIKKQKGYDIGKYKYSNVILGTKSGYLYQTCIKDGEEGNKCYVKRMSSSL